MPSLVRWPVPQPPLLARVAASRVIRPPAAPAAAQITPSGAGWSAAATTAQATSPTLNITGVADGDTVVVGITGRLAAGGLDVATISPDQTGWTQVAHFTDASATDNKFVYLYRVWHTGDPTSFTWTSTVACAWQIAAMGYAGTLQSGPVGASSAGEYTGASATTHDTAQITVATTGAWVVALANDRSASTWTPPAGYTERLDVRAGATSQPDVTIADSGGVVSPGTVGPLTFTGTVATSVAATWIFELKPAVGAPSGPAGPAQGGQRSGGVSVAAKQATVTTAIGPQRTAGTATDRKQALGASQGQQRASGTSVGVRQVTWPAQGSQRTSATAASRKQATAAAVGQQHPSGQSATTKGGVGAPQGQQRTSGAATRVTGGAQQGSQRVAGTSAGAKQTIGAAQGPNRVATDTCGAGYGGDTYADTYGGACRPGSKGTSGAPQGQQRTSGAATRIPGGPHVGSQRTSGTAAGKLGAVGAASGQARAAGTSAGKKQLTVASSGQQRTQGVAARIPTGPARATVRTAGQSAGIKNAAVATVGSQRTSGLAAGIHSGVGAAQGSQRTASATAGKHGGTTIAVGQTRSSGAALTKRITAGGSQGAQHTTGTTAVVKGGRGVAQGPQRVAGTAAFLKVPPPRWVEHDATASGLVEADMVTSGLVEGDLVAAGIVEGSSSL